MHEISTFAFAGGALDRVAALRDDAAAFERCLRGPHARILPLWRGKPLMVADALGWVKPGHAVLAQTVEPPILLGRAGGDICFAADVSAWCPDDQDLPQSGTFFDPTEQRHPALPPDHRFVELRAVMTRLTPTEAEIAATAKAITGWHRSHRFCSSCGQRSEMIQAGWQRLCPACGARHFPRTDPVVIMLVTAGNRALIGRSPGWPDGMYSCLAGFVEPGETIEAAVRREVAEEAGIGVGRVRILASQPWPWPSSLMIGCHAQAQDDAISLNDNELEDARWITREEAMLALAGRHPDIRPPRAGAIAAHLLALWVAARVA
ncbi:NAD+ diphosphatase [Albidovulum inexpectatum]|uniref:NAD(+) diphosphatase n=1 Tax=Albidovulum inexpectatum TaxID=196587 RepID=A0A2S5JKV6_9RHOB|nr:NAD(+) diphosphatase [Albidovulum inexpectatum]PPB82187.1 NAD+ diphosphatase [Albidovulum inexpectatum]